jgi:RNA polymerase sigma factor (sigma-70 family)
MISFKEEGHSIAVGVARKFQRRAPWIPFDDLYQEAWIGLLGAKKYNESKGSRRSYLYRAASNRVSDHICAFRLTMSGGNFRAIDVLAEIKSSGPEKLDTAVSPTEPPDILLENAQEEKKREARIKQEVKKIRKIILKHCDNDKQKASLLERFITKECKAKEIAELLGVEINRIYETTRAIKRKANNAPNRAKEI